MAIVGVQLVMLVALNGRCTRKRQLDSPADFADDDGRSTGRNGDNEPIEFAGAQAKHGSAKAAELKRLSIRGSMVEIIH